MMVGELFSKLIPDSEIILEKLAEEINENTESEVEMETEENEGLENT